jgi:outer membrane lipoprotein carrier protein
MYRWVALWLLSFAMLAGIDAERLPAAVPLDVETILSHIEARYGQGALLAHFDQTSVLKAMAIADKAEGRLWVRHPGQMRWEYTAPEKQVIVSDGVQLWVYRPEDRQVMVGQAPSFFGDGKGAGFLSDIRQMRRQFNIELMDTGTGDKVGLRLTPHESQPDLVRIELGVDPQDWTIHTVTTYNAYGDETRIELSDMMFVEHLDDALFHFQIPDGVEIMQMAP